ncbi:MAG: Ig-like domain-containing protein, partial [Nitrososphaeraceae archaeon]
VDLVLMGHVHNYQRSFPLKYNGNDPSEPIITSSNVHNYLDPIGQIYTIVGTAGINFHALSGKESYIDYQQDSKFGFLNIHFSKDGKTMNSKFISNDGSVMDQFSIEKSQIQKNKKIDDKNPTADAGDDQKVQVRNEVKLDGSQSTDNDGKIVSFKWEQTDGPKVNLNSDQDKATFVVPDSATDSNLAFKLTVVDDKDASSSDDVIVQVEKVVENVPPTADDQKTSVDKNSQIDIALVGKDDHKGSIQFEIVSGPSEGRLVNFDEKKGIVTYIPKKDYTGDDEFRFRVTDNKRTSSNIATVNVNVKEINQPLKTSENISRFKATLLQNGTNVHHDLILSSFTIDNGKLNVLSSDYPKKVTFKLQQNLPINIVLKNGDSNVFVKDIILHDEENNPYHLKMNRDNNWIPSVPVGNYKIEIQGKYSQGNDNLVSFIDRVEILKNIKVN